MHGTAMLNEFTSARTRPERHVVGSKLLLLRLLLFRLISHRRSLPVTDQKTFFFLATAQKKTEKEEERERNEKKKNKKIRTSWFGVVPCALKIKKRKPTVRWT